MKTSMDCSVVIPTRDGTEHARACIESLRAQLPRPVEEILVVDDGVGSAACLADEFEEVRVLRHERPRGFGAAANTGIWQSSRSRILILNDDTRCAPHMVGHLLEALEAPGVGLAGPVSNEVKPVQKRTLEPGFGRSEADQRALEAELQQLPPLREVDDLSGLCLAFRRSTIDRIGGFDESFFPGLFEDDDLSLRARLRGLRLVVAQHAFVWHEGHATFARLGIETDELSRPMQERFLEKWGRDPVGEALVAHRLGRHSEVGPAVDRARARWPEWTGPDHTRVRDESAVLAAVRSATTSRTS